jgi:hypothetical protein
MMNYRGLMGIVHATGTEALTLVSVKHSRQIPLGD